MQIENNQRDQEQFDLAVIQRVQFTDLELANRQMSNFLRLNSPYGVRQVNIRPLAVSLNSINGFVETEERGRLFFKTHVEPGSTIDEYYNSQVLLEAGYPVISPVFSSTELGKQILFYDVVDYPTVFDFVRALETDRNYVDGELALAQEKSDHQLLDIYRSTMRNSLPSENALSPIHQLFYHRLVGERFTSFYENKLATLPGFSVDFSRLMDFHWVINGVEYKHTLREIVASAISNLLPNKQPTPSVIGHGDAHNGNVFFNAEDKQLIYFDPAFAGRHSPFLDLTKPLFHNVFADWMYFPEEIAQQLIIETKLIGSTLHVNHNHIPSKMREFIFQSKIKNVFNPLIRDLCEMGCLDPSWPAYLKSALACCPLLTRNLIDQKIFSPPISLLGLCLTVTMGSESVQPPTDLMNIAICNNQ